MSQKKSTLQPDTEGQLLDLDDYRKMRELRGDWPPTREEQEKFFSQFVKVKKRG